MKERLGIKEYRPLADFLPTLSIAAKNLATEMTNYNVEEKDLQGEPAITNLCGICLGSAVFSRRACRLRRILRSWSVA